MLDAACWRPGSNRLNRDQESRARPAGRHQQMVGPPRVERGPPLYQSGVVTG